MKFLTESISTATLLSGCIYNLLTYPEKMKALVDEIRGSFTKLDELTFENLAELKYMNACKSNPKLECVAPQNLELDTNRSP